MLARLILPANRLDEFGESYRQLFPDGSHHDPWKISVLIPAVNAEDDQFDQALQAIHKFHQQQDFALVDTVEGKLPDPEQVDATCQQLPESLAAYLEVPFANPGAAIQRLATAGRAHTFAKIRTGGVTRDLIPDSRQVAQFIHQCVQADLGFKATAGLHHPLRGEFALTYEPNAPRSLMHGFMNVFLAACLTQHRNWSVPRLQTLLENGNPGAWEISEQSITIDGDSVSNEEIAATRNQLAHSFGSCSFVEPIEDLTGLGWLADSPKTV
jgi:hypothetical protein